MCTIKSHILNAFAGIILYYFAVCVTVNARIYLITKTLERYGTFSTIYIKKNVTGNEKMSWKTFNFEVI